MKLYLIEYGTDGPDHKAYVLINRLEELRILMQAYNFTLWKSELLASLKRSVPCLLLDLPQITNNDLR